MSQQPPVMPPQERPSQPPMYPPLSQLQMPPPQMEPQKPKSRKRLWLIIGAVVLVLIVIGAIASQAGNSSQPTTTPQVTQPAGSSQQPTTRPATPTTQPTTATYPQFGDGTFVVGKDIQPGTYRTREASSGCYYARLSGFGGTLGEIIANNNTDAPAIVTIAATDKGFESTRCGTWTKE